VELIAQNSEFNPVELGSLAEELRHYDQVLCILNTRKDCRELHEKMPAGTIHLSALMCPAHRSDVIGSIKNKLRNNEPLKVISTQIVEAGVDLDFPVVYRALAGMDSLIQAAGRCNREGMLSKGKLFYFVSPKQAPPGLMRKGEDSSREIMRLDKCLSFEPEVITKYFNLFFKKANTFDKENIEESLVKNSCNCHIQFRTASQKFKLINDQTQRSVIVIYPKEQAMIENLLKKLNFSADKDTMRKLQRFTVSIPENNLAELRKIGAIKLQNGFWVQATDDLYDEILGFIPKKGLIWNPDFFIV
jgi:CRISPR-associated endonuclease/helicase Cas3